MISVDVMPFGPIALPLVAAVIVLAVTRTSVRSWAHWTSRSATLVAFGLSTGLAGRLLLATRVESRDTAFLIWSPFGRAPIGLGFHLDSLGAASLIVVLLIGLVAATQALSVSEPKSSAPIILASTGLGVALVVVNEIAILALIWSILALTTGVLEARQTNAIGPSSLGRIAVAVMGGIGLNVGGAAVAATNDGSGLIGAGASLRDAGAPLAVLFLVAVASCGIPPFPTISDSRSHRDQGTMRADTLAIRAVSAILLVGGYYLAARLISFGGPTFAMGWRAALVAVGLVGISSGAHRFYNNNARPISRIDGTGIVLTGLALATLAVNSSVASLLGLVLVAVAGTVALSPGMIRAERMAKFDRAWIPKTFRRKAAGWIGLMGIDRAIATAAATAAALTTWSAEYLVQFVNRIANRYDRAALLIAIVIVVIVFGR